jgi:acetyl-CoA acyltransferase
MPAAVIVDAVRTPLGRRNGALKDVHPVDLSAHTLAALVQRNDLDPQVVEDVIMGCVMQVGDQAVNVGRNAALAAGFPESVVGTTVDRQCGSSQQAAHFAAQGVMSGAYDVVIAAGIESMTRVPMGESIKPGSLPFGPKVLARYQEQGGLVPQGISAELIAEKWGIPRDENDCFSLESHQRAARAIEEGRFEREIVPIEVTGEDGTRLFDRDEGVRPDTSLEKLSGLKPAFKPDGVITAGNSSQISDGAAALLITTEEAASRLGLTPRARFHSFALAGVDPIMMLTGPIPATAKVLERAKMTLDQMDLVEINEAFSSVVLAWEQEHHPDMAKVNVNGGAIAMGHPLGCSGARLTATLVNELERSAGRWGLQVMCEGGGMANAMIIERLG